MVSQQLLRAKLSAEDLRWRRPCVQRRAVDTAGGLERSQASGTPGSGIDPMTALPAARPASGIPKTFYVASQRFSRFESLITAADLNYQRVDGRAASPCVRPAAWPPCERRSRCRVRRVRLAGASITQRLRVPVRNVVRRACC
jgi:hypothetical protein